MLSSLILASLSASPATFDGPRLSFEIAKRGTFVIATDPKHSPKTVAQIVRLVKAHFYDKQCFHRVEGWVIQWGDPASKKGPDTPGVGNGGSGKSIPFEESPVSFLKGVVGIASTGSKVRGDSQLFILTADTPRLDKSYAVLGKVVSGMDVVLKIKKGDVIMRATLSTPKAHSAKR